MGLDPGTLGSCPGPKADAQPRATQVPPTYFLCVTISPSVNRGGKWNGLLLKLGENTKTSDLTFGNKMWREGEKGQEETWKAAVPGQLPCARKATGWGPGPWLPGRPFRLLSPKTLPPGPGPPRGLWRVPRHLALFVTLSKRRLRMSETQFRHQPRADNSSCAVRLVDVTLKEDCGVCCVSREALPYDQSPPLSGLAAPSLLEESRAWRCKIEGSKTPFIWLGDKFFLNFL